LAVWAASWWACPFPGCSFRIHAVEVAFEGIHVSGPEPAELSQPGIQFLKWLGVQPVEAALRVHPGFHEASFAQNSQVLRYGRLRHMKLTLNVSHRLLRQAEKAQYRAAVRLCNDIEYGFHGRYILYLAYTCQGIYEDMSRRLQSPGGNALFIGDLTVRGGVGSR